MAEQQPAAPAPAAALIKIVKLGHNATPREESVVTLEVSPGRCEELLAHPQRMACAVPALLGYPIALVPAGDNPPGAFAQATTSMQATAA